jgi:hypothetical protein
VSLLHLYQVKTSWEASRVGDACSAAPDSYNQGALFHKACRGHALDTVAIASLSLLAHEKLVSIDAHSIHHTGRDLLHLPTPPLQGWFLISGLLCVYLSVQGTSDTCGCKQGGAGSIWR